MAWSALNSPAPDYPSLFIETNLPSRFHNNLVILLTIEPHLPWTRQDFVDLDYSVLCLQLSSLLNYLPVQSHPESITIGELVLASMNGFPELLVVDFRHYRCTTLKECPPWPFNER